MSGELVSSCSTVVANPPWPQQDMQAGYRQQHHALQQQQQQGAAATPFILSSSAVPCNRRTSSSSRPPGMPNSRYSSDPKLLGKRKRGKRLSMPWFVFVCVVWNFLH